MVILYNLATFFKCNVYNMAKGSLLEATGKIMEVMDARKAQELWARLYEAISDYPSLKVQIEALYDGNNPFSKDKTLEALKSSVSWFQNLLSHVLPEVVLNTVFAQTAQKDKNKELIIVAEHIANIWEIMLQTNENTVISFKIISKQIENILPVLSKEYTWRANKVLEKMQELEKRMGYRKNRLSPRTVVDTTATRTHEVISRKPKTKKKKSS